MNKKLFAIIFVVALGMLGCSSPQEQILDQEEDSVIETSFPDTEADCTASGGEWKKAGMMGYFRCIRTYSDGGVPCTDSDDCEGNCVVFAAESEAVCKHNDNPFGCYSTIENYREEGGILCRD